jgi:hypothetical protein
VTPIFYERSEIEYAGGTNPDEGGISVK